jgi:hypothetical protein
LLAAALFLELWLNRTLSRLLRIDPGNAVAGALRRFDVAAVFVFELVSALGAILFAWAIVRIVRSPKFSGPTRFSFGLVGGLAAALITTGIFIRLPPRLAAYLCMVQLFLLLRVVLAVVAVPTSRRLRVGIVLLVLPVALMLTANLLQRYSAPGVLDPRASMLAELAGAALVFVGLASPWLLGPSGASGPLAYIFALAIAATGITLGRVDWDGAARLAGIGLGVAVPIGPVGLPLYVVGASAYAFTIGGLLMRPGADRLRGIGLFLVGVVGLQLDLPYQIAASTLGLLCLLEVATHPAEDAITREALDELMRRWAALVGAGQVTVVGAPGQERARVGFQTVNGLPATLLVDRRAGAIAQIDIAVGEIPGRTPPVTLSARGTRLGPAAPGPVVATGDVAFDERFVRRDHRGASAAMLDAETRGRILRLADGWLGVWPQRGARFVGRQIPAGDDALPSLVQLLCDLRERAGS